MPAPTFDDLARDARFAIRALRRAPGFTALSLVTLALGIGATTAVFTLVNGVLLKPLPFEAPDRLVSVWEVGEKFGRMSVSVPNFLDWHAATRSFDGLASMRGGETTVLGGREPVRAPVYTVSHDFFHVLRATPTIGRTFSAAESQPGGAPVVVVSHGFWQRYLGAAPIASASLQLADRTFAVIGVMPATFDFPEGAAAWIPVEPFNGGIGRTGHNDDVIGRLAPGVTIDQARAELSAIAARIRKELGTGSDAIAANVISLRDEQVGPVRTYLTLLLGAVLFVLLVACVNLAGAGLARAATREHEMAIRSALGAARSRLVRQLLTESLLLSIAGGAAGLALSVWVVRVLLALSPRSLPRAAEVGIDVRVTLFALGLSIVTGVLVGLLPAFQVSRGALRAALAEGGRASGDARARLRRTLVGVEIALALVLLVGAGLLIRSFALLLREAPGFDARGVITADVSLPGAKYDDGAKRATFYEAAGRALRAVPGVQHAGLINIVPLTRAGFGGGLNIAERPGETASAEYRVVDEEYFATMRIPLLAGRLFDARDDSTAMHVTMINRAMAERFWPGESPLGKRIRSLGMDSHRDVWLTVIGVVANVKNASLVSPPSPEHFVFYRQRPERANNASFVVRSSIPAATVAGAVRSALRSIDSDVPVELATMNDIVAGSVADRRFVMMMLTGFGVLALGLAAVGIYGVLSYTVARRTREIGVRVALGAEPARILSMILRDSLVPVALGSAAGLVGAAAITRLLGSLLYNVSPVDPLTFAAVLAVLTFVAVVASLVPARRASRVDPIVALQAE